MTYDARSRRFTDSELQEFYREFKEHAANSNARYTELCDELRGIAAVTRELAEANRQNSESIQLLAESTADLVAAWKAANGAVAVAAWVGRAAKWFASIAVVLAALWYFLKTGEWRM